jgi:transcription-repair coupling factor (superfamily II helicase)
MDIFSIPNESPFRIELFGDEIESIRTFDPNSQLSIGNETSISIIPNIQTRLLQETRESFFNYISPKSKLFFKDVSLTVEIIEKYFSKWSDHFETLKEKVGQKVY